ncbi:hypothetical protein NIIDMKKI_13890 [Mycobacterium kansasii]|uniref:Uncharacterized protein n=1 Tax=Mycobacterium kansasii TaxID=1768 RepID=A0A1V3XGT1_MYCKA|nr:hypothetical protein I547_3562 [Mycobacterium kansasii 824]OOK78308.1 hypothetical protein BZL30_2604 [Mycobacterium kansasii]BCI86183.1 hypothetical protein NIIDMKKI_13890 [Mycobacterium kansasii]
MGRSVAAFDTHEANPEQSVPDGESPPGIYGVPETWLISVNSVAKAIMGRDTTDNMYRKPNNVVVITINQIIV